MVFYARKKNKSEDFNFNQTSHSVHCALNIFFLLRRAMTFLIELTEFCYKMDICRYNMNLLQRHSKRILFVNDTIPCPWDNYFM